MLALLVEGPHSTRTSGRAGPPLVPVGDGDQLRAVVGAEAPGLAVGHRVLSQPVAGGAVPRPTLAQESGQKRGCLGEGCFSLTPKSRGGDADSGTT